MDNAVEMAPTVSAVSIVALCAALALSRATFYRQRAAAEAVAQASSIVTAGSASQESVEHGGQRLGAAFGPETEGATASPAVLDLAAEVDAMRSHAEMHPSIEDAALDLAVDVAVAPAAEIVTSVAITPAPAAPARKPQHRRIPDEERAVVLATLNDDRFCNLAPAEVWATLLDEGKLLCSATRATSPQS